jgi:hypothetical protein
LNKKGALEGKININPITKYESKNHVSTNKTEKIIIDATTIMHKSVNESGRLKKDMIFFINFLNYLF